MQQASREHPRLGSERGRPALAGVEAPRGRAADVGGPRERAQARVVARAPVVHRRGRHVADPAAGSEQAPLPALLVPGPHVGLVEAPDAGHRAAPQRHVRAPGVIDVAVGRAEVLAGDGRALAPARAEAVVLEARADRAGEHADVLPGARFGREQRGQPARSHLDVVVDVDEQVAARLVDPRVARAVETGRPRVGDVAGAVTPRRVARLGVRPVVDDQHLGSGRRRLWDDRRERHVEIPRPVTGGDDDARCQVHFGR